MSWGMCRGGGVMIMSTMVMCSGCCHSERECPPTLATEVQTEGGLIFGTPRETLMATHMPREEWPVTPNGYVTPQDTYYVEYYQDYYGSPWSEYSTPRRNFYSWSVGASSKDPRP